MPNLLADVNIEGHVIAIVNRLRQKPYAEAWSELCIVLENFNSIGLVHEASDRIVWETAQKLNLVLVTANRNSRGKDSLEATMRELNTLDSLPVMTISNAKRFFKDREYAERVVEKLFEYMIEIERYRGAGRLYLPGPKKP